MNEATNSLHFNNSLHTATLSHKRIYLPFVCGFPFLTVKIW